MEIEMVFTLNLMVTEKANGHSDHFNMEIQ